MPLSIRKPLVLWIYRQEWINSNRRNWWSIELLKDYAETESNEYHKFLWSNHLTYAVTYEVEQQYGSENIKTSREMFLGELVSTISKAGLDWKHDVKSVFEVGCSLGYQLRYIEKELFKTATEIKGIDIDKHAIEEGRKYLRKIGSKVEIACEDMENIDRILKSRQYDIIICTGVLMYLNENSGMRLVKQMLKHTGTLLAVSGLAHPEIDNENMEKSELRDFDRSFIHNIDMMVKKAGGRIVARRWEGNRVVDGHTIYFVFAMNDR